MAPSVVLSMALSLALAVALSYLEGIRGGWSLRAGESATHTVLFLLWLY